MEQVLFIIGNTVDSIVAAGTQGFVDSVRNFIAPFLMVAVSILSVTFIAKRQFMQLLTFIVFVIIVFALFYGGDFLAKIGQDAGESAKSITW